MEGSRGVIREESGCSGLSSEAERLLHTEADLLERVTLCVFVRTNLPEMSFYPRT